MSNYNKHLLFSIVFIYEKERLQKSSKFFNIFVKMSTSESYIEESSSSASEVEEISDYERVEEFESLSDGASHGHVSSASEKDVASSSAPSRDVAKPSTLGGGEVSSCFDQHFLRF